MILQGLLGILFMIIVEFWIFFLIGLVLIINIPLTVYVFKDAKKYDMDGSNWGTLVFILGCCGLIFYLMAKKDHSKK